MAMTVNIMLSDGVYGICGTFGKIYTSIISLNQANIHKSGCPGSLPENGIPLLK